MEERFVDLESKVAYLEYHQEELNKVVTRQQNEIHMLQERLTALVKHIQTQGLPMVDPKDEPPPPHY